MGALFMRRVLVGFVTWMGEKTFTEVFINGARDLLGVPLLLDSARYCCLS